MLPRAHRLRRNADFREAFARGRSYSHRHLRMVAHVSGGAASRVGLVVSKRIGGAVRRNRVKRLLREACRMHVRQWRPGADVVFIARPSLRDASLAEVQAAVAELADAARLVGQGDATGARDSLEEAPSCGDSASA